LKVVLIVGGLLLVLLVVAVVGVVYVAQKYGPGLVAAGKQSMDEGRAYGRGTDEEGCVNEAVSRHKRADGLSAVINNNLFLRTCLDASRPTPHFCDAVPQRMEFMKGARWQLDECKRYGLTPERQCGQLFQQVQQYCDQLGRTGAKPAAPASPEDYSDDGTDAGGDEDSAPPPPPPTPRRSK
jgi:hypothetical protein